MTYENADDYQNQALTTAKLDADSDLWYFALGLGGETGEVQEHIKKMYRDDGGVMTEGRRAKVLLELGDVAWYLAVLTKGCGFTLSEVFDANIAKLTARNAANTVHGAGASQRREGN